MKIIALAGARGVGKDYNAAWLETKGYVHYKFADPVISQLVNICRISKEEVYRRKERGQKFWIGTYLHNYREAMQIAGFISDSKTSNTEQMRIRLETAERLGLNIVISDLRTKDELEMLNVFGAATVEIQKEGIGYTGEKFDEELMGVSYFIDTYEFADTIQP